VPADDTLILCYHSVSESWPQQTSVTPSALAGHVATLVERGYRGATFSDAVLAPARRRTVAFTFDDAHRSVLELAYPILSAAGWPGTVFVPTDYCTALRPLDWPGLGRWRGGEWDHELMCMSWQELERLAGDGWEIGSHTCSHPRLSSLPAAEITHELEASRAEIERRLDRPCETLAYPYSDYDQRVVRAARAAGYRLAATAPTTRPAPLPLLWPRPVIAREDVGWRFRVRTSATLRHMERVPLVGQASLRLRHRVGRLAKPRQLHAARGG
jgi:peptidoglycan/xylan/chitin deacetylase (PgdA/CDA1 family)